MVCNIRRKTLDMKLKNQICIAAVAGVVAGLVVYSLERYRKSQMRKQVAAEGYETAHEVLFPHVKDMGTKLQYGPVIPEL